MRDLLIIGGGPAGMTASVYAARKKIDFAMITKDLGGQTAWSWGVENYTGFSYIKGSDLVARFEEHIKHFNFPIEYTGVTSINKEDDGFLVTLDDDRTMRARSVIIASGKSPRRLGVPGEERLTGRGVSYCATCDAPIFNGMNVAVIGGGNSALTSAIQLLDYATSVSIISYEDWTGDPILKDQLTNSPKVTAHRYSEVAEVMGEKMVSAIRIRSRRAVNEETIPVQGVFVEIGQVPNSGLVRGITDINADGEIVIDSACRTKIPGLFAAGDVTTVQGKQIIIAAGEGAKAALMTYEYLLRLGPEKRPGEQAA